jgi:hypothetical protein
MFRYLLKKGDLTYVMHIKTPFQRRKFFISYGKREWREAIGPKLSGGH